MWQITVFCSGCNEESEVTIEDLEDVEREVCPCGYSVIVLSVESFEPHYAVLASSQAQEAREDRKARQPSAVKAR